MSGLLRASIVQAARAMDQSVGRLFTRARVLVDARTPMNLAVLRPVWRQLLDDPRVDVRFTTEAGPGTRGSGTGYDLGDALVTREAAAWSRFDLAMTADLWNRTPLHRCRRRINFFHGVAGKYDLDDPSRLESADLHELDRIAFINADRMRRYLDAGLVTTRQAVLVGFPKGDELLNGTWDPSVVRSTLGLSPSLPTVLYAPTFSTASSLHLAGEAIIATILDSGRNVIAKLHDRSMVPHDRYTGGIDWPARLSRFDANPRFALVRDADAGPCLAAADVLVTDHSTVGFEFALLDRPLIVYDAPGLRDAARIDADKWSLLRSMAEVVDTPRVLAAAIDAAFADPRQRQPERRRARDLFANPGTATPRAVQVVYELLELQPAARPLAGAAGVHQRA